MNFRNGPYLSIPIRGLSASFEDNRMTPSAPGRAYETHSKALRAMTLPPGTSRLPVMHHRAVMACAVGVIPGVESIGSPQWTDDGLLCAKNRAAAWISFFGTHVISDTRSGEYWAACAQKASQTVLHSTPVSFARLM